MRITYNTYNLDENSTEKVIKKRIKEINKQRNELSEERERLQNIINDYKQKEIVSNRKTYEGKYFIISKDNTGKYNHIKAFKILKTLDDPNEDSAECLCICEYNSICDQKGIVIQTLPLWIPNELRLSSKETDPKVIDYYKEISKEKFDKIFDEMYKILCVY